MVQKDRGPGVTDAQYGEMVIYGTPKQVVEKVQELDNAGVQYLVLNMNYGNEEEALKLFSEKVMPEFTS